MTATVTRGVLTVAMVVTLVAAVLTVLAGGNGKKHLTAYFSATNNLFAGGQVKVLGVQVGTIDEIRAEGTRVRVDMTYDAEQRLPADVQAVIVPPSMLGDRFIQLTPAYTGGRVLPADATLPVRRTSVPLEVDETYRNLDQLASALGPKGANRTGALSRLIRSTAKNLGGNGAEMNRAIRDLADAVDTLAGAGPDMAGTVSNLASITENLAGNDRQVRILVSTLTDVSTELNGQRGNLRRAVSTLGDALGDLGGLIKHSRPELKKALSGLAKTTGTLARHQRDLAEILDIAPLALTNVHHTNQPQNYDPVHPDRVHPDARTAAVTTRASYLNDLDTQLGYTLSGLCGSLEPAQQRQLAALCTALRQAGNDLGAVLMRAANPAAEDGREPRYPTTLGGLLLGGQQ